MNNETNRTNIKEVLDNYFPQREVIKINKTSYILMTIESLARIKSFSDYFINNNTIKKEKKKISGEFKDYMEKLRSNEKLKPIDFIKNLMKNDINEKLSLNEELEPYIFYDFILEKLNDELNEKEPDVPEYFNNFAKKYDTDNELKNFMEDYVKENHSIVSKTFNGILKIISSCDLCHEDEKTENKIFNVIDININDFCNNRNLEGYSLTNFSIEDLIEFYFEERKEEIKGKKCPVCEKKGKTIEEKTIKKKIIELPNFLIFRINWGKFEANKGFKPDIEYIKPGYEYLDVDEIIEIKKEYFDDKAYNDNNEIKDSIKFQLFSVIGYFFDDRKEDISKHRLVFINKYRTNDGKWFNFWCNGKGEEKLNYTDNFTVPCLLFYVKIN